MLTIHDGASQLRIAICGWLSGNTVNEAARQWKQALDSRPERPVIVDISELKGYDVAGASLLREMLRHGTRFAARNAESLTFYNEISTKVQPGPILVYDSGETRRSKTGGRKNLLSMRAASGE
jgi:ABC-type transporter Mla MlaB component